MVVNVSRPCRKLWKVARKIALSNKALGIEVSKYHLYSPYNSHIPMLNLSITFRPCYVFENKYYDLSLKLLSASDLLIMA